MKVLARAEKKTVAYSKRYWLMAGAAFLASAAHAQTPPAANVTLKDVVVTATRKATKLQKTPVAVTVFGGKQIAAQHLTTTRDLAGKTPGVTIVRAGITPLTQVFFVRGIGNSDPIFDPNIGQYLDEVYLPRAINGLSDLTDLQQIEVLRGPQGTLFGENSDAGAILYTTKTPSATPTGNFDIGYGNYNTFQLHAYGSGPIIPGLLDGSIAFAHDTHGGYTYDPTIGKRVNNQDTNGGRIKLLATPSPDLSVTFEADGVLDNSATDFYTPVDPILGGTLKTPVYGNTDLNDSYAAQYPKNDSYDAGVSLKVVYNIDPNLTFKSISAYRGFNQNPVNYNNDGEPLVAYSPADPIPVSISDNYIVYREQELTQEFQLAGNYDKFDFVSGLYFLHENFASNRIGFIVSPTAATPTPSAPEDQIGDTKTTDYAAYAQADYHLTDQLIATLGGRYTIENRGFRFHGVFDTLAGFPLPATSPAAAADFTYYGDKTWYSFTPKYGLSYQFTPSIFGYATISEGFNAGGFNNRATTLATALPYDQENVTTYEVGLKTDLLSHRLRLNGDLFWNQYTGLQQTAAVISPLTNGLVSVRTNAGNAHTNGFELESTAEPVDGLILTGNVSYLWTRFDSFPSAGTSVNTGKLVSATGNQIPFAPRWQLYGAANYTIPADLHGTVSLGADISYETSYFSDVFNYPQGIIHPQAFTDANIRYAPSFTHWTATLTGQNIFNRLAFQSLTWSGTRNLYQGPVSPPATIFFKLGYAF